MCIPLSKWLIAMVRTQSYVGDTIILYTPVIPHLYQFYPIYTWDTPQCQLYHGYVEDNFSGLAKI